MMGRQLTSRLMRKTVTAPKQQSDVTADTSRSLYSVSRPRTMVGIRTIVGITQLDPSKFAFGPAPPSVITEAEAGTDRDLRKYDPHAAQDIPVINAAFDGNVSEVRKYLDSGGEPNLAAHIDRLNNIITPLIAAISVGQRKVIKTLIARGADVNFNPGGFHNSPLVLAAAEGEQDVVQDLLSAGADINQVNGVGTTPIQAAVLGGNYSTVKVLLQQGAGVGSVLTPSGRLPAYVEKSTKPNYMAIKKLLIAHGAIH